MRKLRIYVDTSVFGGTEDPEFAEASRLFFEQVVSGRYLIIISRTVLEEIGRAPEQVRKLLESLPVECIEIIRDSDEIASLAKAYLEAGILGASSIADAFHVAGAASAGADVILSWNFKHIVNLDRIRKYNAINALNGFRTLDIRSPAEIVYGDQD